MIEDKPSGISVSPRLKQIISQLLQLEFECNEKNEKNSILLNQQLISKTMEIRAVQIQYEKALEDVGREKSTSKELQALLEEKTQQFSVMSTHLLKVEKELEFHKKNSEVLKEKVNTLTYQINNINKKQHQGEELPGCNRSALNTSTNIVSATHESTMDGRHKQILNSNQPQLISSKGESFFSAVCETQSSTMEVSDHNKQLQTNSESLSMDHALGKIANFSSAIFTDNFIAQELRDSLISSVPPLLPTSNFTVGSSNSGPGFLSVEFGNIQTASGRSGGLVHKTIQRQSPSNMYQSPSQGSPEGKSIDTGNTTKSPSTDLSDELSRDFQSFFSTPQNTSTRGESSTLHGFGSMSPFAGLFGSDSSSHGREDEGPSVSRVSVSPIPLNLSGSGAPSPSESHDHQQSLDSMGHNDINGPGNGRRMLYHSSGHHAPPSSSTARQQQGMFTHSGNRNNSLNSSHSTSFNNGGEQQPHVFSSSNNYSPNNAHANHNGNGGGGGDFNKRPCMFHLSEIWGLYGLDGNKLTCKYRNRCFDMHKPLLMRKGYKKADIAVYIDKFNLVSKADAHRALREDEDFPDGSAPAGDSSAPSPVNGSGSPGQAGGFIAGFGNVAGPSGADPKKGFRCCVPNLVHLWGLKYPDGNVISDCHSPNGQCQHIHKTELMKHGMYTRSNIIGALHIYYAKNKDRLPDVLRALDADIDIQAEHYSLSAVA